MDTVEPSDAKRDAWARDDWNSWAVAQLILLSMVVVPDPPRSTKDGLTPVVMAHRNWMVLLDRPRKLALSTKTPFAETERMFLPLMVAPQVLLRIS